jgi:hypothetical protein
MTGRADSFSLHPGVLLRLAAGECVFRLAAGQVRDPDTAPGRRAELKAAP